MPTARQSATGDDAVLGVRPSYLLQPNSLDEAEEAMRQAAVERWRLAFLGGGTELDLGEPPTGLDAVLRTGALRRLVEYAPLDQIVTVEAGMTLGSLQSTLREQRQMLALDPPWAERATVGGVLASNAFGVRRTLHGTVRDLIIGVTLIRADGTRAKGGGKVVKNVAGFDLPKLMVGSLGSLGLIATVTFRLHPLPESASTVYFPRAAPEALGRVVQALQRAQLVPAAVAALWSESGIELGVRFEGFEAGVRQQRDRLATLAGQLELLAERLEESAAEGFWSRHAALREAPATVRAKLATLPTELPHAIAEVWPLLRDVLQAPRAVFYPTLGLAFVAGNMHSGESLAEAVARARAALAGRGGRMILHAAPAELRSRASVWGPPPAATALFSRVKDALDPEHRLAPGRVVGGL
jgi:glycolate oxidase FAD binding subunit